MAVVRHLDFENLQVFVMWPLSACRSAFWCKISLKSDNRSMCYGQKSDGHVTVIGFNVYCMYQILSKSDNFSLRCADLAIFKMAAVRHLGFVMTSQYCIAGHIFVVQILF